MSNPEPQRESKPVSTVEWYDFVGQLTDLIPDIHPGGSEATNALLDLCGLSSESRVLDVGCGSGTTAFQIAERYGARVTGIDISEVMISQAQKGTEQLDIKDLVEFRVADVFSLPFEDESFTTVIFQSVLIALDKNIESAMAEMRRVLTQGGIIGANEGTIDDLAPPEYVELLERHPAVYRYFTSESLRGLFEDSGFKILDLIETRNADTPKVSRKIGFGSLLAFLFTVYPGMLLKLIRNSKLREASSVDGKLTKLSKKYAGYTLVVGKRSE
jgi:ubiquinone/menaquinone biosynthesis C-methylase UbiE